MAKSYDVTSREGLEDVWFNLIWKRFFGSGGIQIRWGNANGSTAVEVYLLLILLLFAVFCMLYHDTSRAHRPIFTRQRWWWRYKTTKRRFLGTFCVYSKCIVYENGADICLMAGRRRFVKTKIVFGHFHSRFSWAFGETFHRRTQHKWAKKRAENSTHEWCCAFFVFAFFSQQRAKALAMQIQQKLLITQWGIRRIFMSIFVRQIIVDYIINLTIKSYELDYRTR